MAKARKTKKQRHQARNPNDKQSNSYAESRFRRSQGMLVDPVKASGPTGILQQFLG